jgi:seryl-tRNA synthetase
MDFINLPGLRWMENGQCVLSGAPLKLYRKLDALFKSWAAQWNAMEFRVPTFVPAAEMHKLDYFRSFPHLITFPVTLNSEQENLLDFGERMHENGVQLTQIAPILDILTPAACYHFYILLQGQSLDQPRYLTTCATCFRKETHYSPLQRHWSFSMREIVCLGDIADVQEFLRKMRDTVEQFAASISLPVTWIEATDPFFNAAVNPKYLSQILEPVKTEMLFESRLAIGSINFHRNFFGETFQIQMEGKEAFSGCVAFGIERWMYAFLTHFGLDENTWPIFLTEERKGRKE